MRQYSVVLLHHLGDVLVKYVKYQGSLQAHLLILKIVVRTISVDFEFVLFFCYIKKKFYTSRSVKPIIQEP